MGVSTQICHHSHLGPNHFSPLKVPWRPFSILCTIMHACPSSTVHGRYVSLPYISVQPWRLSSARLFVFFYHHSHFSRLSCHKVPIKRVSTRSGLFFIFGNPKQFVPHACLRSPPRTRPTECIRADAIFLIFTVC